MGVTLDEPEYPHCGFGVAHRGRAFSLFAASPRASRWTAEIEQLLDFRVSLDCSALLVRYCYYGAFSHFLMLERIRALHPDLLKSYLV